MEQEVLEDTELPSDARLGVKRAHDQIEDVSVDSLSQPPSNPTKRSRRKATHVNVGQLGDITNEISICHNGMHYVLHVTTAREISLERIRFKEIHSLVLKHDVWEASPLPAGKRTVGGRLLRDVKASGRYKSRYVCKGYIQIKNEDYFETFALVTISLFICAYFNLEVGSGDITTAYLNADIEEDIYIYIYIYIYAL